MIPNKQRRISVQRQKILNYLKSVKTHPTAEMVYSGVKNEMPNVSLGTVYRNLNILAEDGEILKLEINNEFHFDGDLCKHQHCVCNQCGKIMDVFQEEISKYALKKINVKGFEAKCVNVIFNGNCKSCRRN